MTHTIAAANQIHKKLRYVWSPNTRVCKQRFYSLFSLLFFVSIKIVIILRIIGYKIQYILSAHEVTQFISAYSRKSIDTCFAVLLLAAFSFDIASFTDLIFFHACGHAGQQFVSVVVYGHRRAHQYRFQMKSIRKIWRINRKWEYESLPSAVMLKDILAQQK